MMFGHKHVLALGVATVGLALSAPSAMASPFDKDDFTREDLASVKITMEEAIAKARTAYAGTPIKAKMEHEDRTIVYEIEMLHDDHEKEVLINAVTGELVHDD